ncbi:hypothetical protein HUJ04_001442 [Dendroctonus ponderosae]|nr:hypothetical protein HUJ04_001442 [Dendroctonus ponderosae]
MTNECSVCQKKFSKHSNLRCHVKKFHPDLLNEVAPNKVFKCSAVCNKCNKTFTMKSNLKQHVLKFHAEEENKLTSLLETINVLDESAIIYLTSFAHVDDERGVVEAIYVCESNNVNR